MGHFLKWGYQQNQDINSVGLLIISAQELLRPQSGYCHDDFVLKNMSPVLHLEEKTNKQ